MKGLSVRVCWCGGLSIRGANEDLSVRCKEHEREGRSHKGWCCVHEHWEKRDDKVGEGG